MRNLMKAQLYQLKKSKRVIIIFFALLFFMQICPIISEWGVNQSLSGSEYIASEGNGAYMAMIALVFSLLFAGYVCGMDFIDRTANYEVMAGYRRYQIYFSKAVISLAGGLLGTVVLLFFPFVFLAGVIDWGDTIALSDVLLRCVFTLLPVLRVTCEFIFLSFIVKNAYIVFFVSYVLGVGGTGLITDYSVLLGTANIVGLFQFPSFMTYTVVDLKEYYIYESALPMGDIIMTITASLVFGALFLYAGFVYYKKDDLR